MLSGWTTACPACTGKYGIKGLAVFYTAVTEYYGGYFTSSVLL